MNLNPPSEGEGFPLARTEAFRDPLDLAGLTIQARGGFERLRVPEDEGFAYWAQWLADRPRRHFDAAVAVTGPEGTGKSTLAMRLAQACDPTWEIRETCYSARDVIRAYRSIRAGHPILYDEGVRGLLAGETFSPEQVALVRTLALAREAGALLFICIPDIWMLAKQFRGRRVTAWFHVKRRGLARAFIRDERLRFTPPKGLGLTESPVAPRLTWSPYPANSRAWRSYLALKTSRLAEFLEETESDLGPATETTRRAMKAARQARWRARKAGGAKPSQEPVSDAGGPGTRGRSQNAPLTDSI